MFGLFSGSSGGQVKSAGPRDVAGRLAEFKVVDVREPAELVGDLGRIQEAVNVPLATVRAKAEAWDRGQKILVVCRSGGRSGAAAAELARMGFTDVTNLSGGMMAWASSGLPVVR